MEKDERRRFVGFSDIEEAISSSSYNKAKGVLGFWIQKGFGFLAVLFLASRLVSQCSRHRPSSTANTNFLFCLKYLSIYLDVSTN